MQNDHLTRAAVSLCLAVFFLPIVAQGQKGTNPAVLVIEHVKLINGVGAEPREDMTVVVRGERIAEVAVSARARIPKGAKRMDGRGKYLIPGLCDAHVHLDLSGESSLALFVANGVTCVRDMARDFVTVANWRREITAGTRLGPRIFASGPALESGRFLAILPKIDEALKFNLTAKILPNRIGVDSPEEARAAVARLAGMGVDFVKFRTVASREVYLAIGDEAKKRGLVFSGHDPVVVNLREASDARQRSIEHLPLESLVNASDGVRQATFRTFAQNGTWIDPTLVSTVSYRGTPDERVMAVIDDKANILDPRRKFIPSKLLEFWREQIVIKQFEEPRDWPALLQQGFADLAAMHRAGVRLVAGTDVGAPLIYPGFSLHDELALLIEKGGVTPLEAIRSATLEPARLLGREMDFGSIEKGKLADLVLLDANPAAEIGNSKRISAVIVNGKWLDRTALDALLSEAVSAAARN